MKLDRLQQIVRMTVPSAIALLVALAAFPCLAGGYRAAPSYSSGVPRVYGFGKGGQSFTYQPAPSVASATARSQSTSSPSPAAQYKLDAFTAPRTATRTPSYSSQPQYFSGRIWYPRRY